LLCTYNRPRPSKLGFTFTFVSAVSSWSARIDSRTLPTLETAAKEIAQQYGVQWINVRSQESTNSVGQQANRAMVARIKEHIMLHNDYSAETFKTVGEFVKQVVQREGGEEE